MSFRILEPEEFDALGPADQQRYLDLLQAELETQGVGWQPTPKQLMADTAADRATETLFGGAAGGGKSDWLLWRADRLSRAIPRHATLFLRGSFPELRRSVIRRSQVRFNYGDDRPVWRAADKEWRYPNGSVIEFGYCVGPDTPIIMADGSLKAMWAITEGDMVATMEGPRRVKRHWHVGRKPSVVMVTPNGRPVVASDSHAVLGADGLWHRPYDLCETSTRSLRDDTPQQPTNGNARRWHRPGSSSHQDRQPTPATGPAERGPAEHPATGVSVADAQTGRTGQRWNTQDVQRPDELYGLATLVELPHLKAGFSPGCVPDGEPQRATGQSPLPGSQAGCPTGIRSHGVRVRHGTTGGPARIPSPADAGLHTRLMSRSGGPTHIPARSRLEAVSYRHPYTMETRAIDGGVRLHAAWVEIFPAGEQDLWDMTVEGANHYLSYGGMVHQNCETDDDVGQYLSAEYDAIFFDELTEFTTYAYEMIRSRARTTRVKALDGARPHICGATNPGRRGHTWVKNLFVLPTDYGNIPDVWATRGLDDDLRFTLLPSDADDERHIAFVPATVLDNPHIDPGYVRHLMSLPENLRRQYLYGDWDVFEGQFFAEFTKTKVDGDGLIIPWHVVEPFDIPSSWPRIRCIDYGFAAPFACLWIAFDENGYGHVYRELYGTKMLPSEQARQIIDLSTFTDTDGRVKPEKIDYTVADPACWSNTGQSSEGLSIAQQWAKHGLQARKANNDRLAGWARVREYLAEDEHGNPGLRIFRTCDNLVRTFPEQIYDKNKPEDLDTTLEDHALDALRYGLQTRPRRYRPKAPPLDRMQQLLKRDRERGARKRSRFPGLS